MRQTIPVAMGNGYGFWWHDVYWASLTTGPRLPRAGRHDIYFGPVGSGGHEHAWIKVAPDESIVMGATLKSVQAVAKEANEVESFSTQPILRGRAHWDPQSRAVTTVISDTFEDSSVSMEPVSSRRTRSTRTPERVELDLPEGSRWFEFELALTRKSDGSTGESSANRILPFGGSSPFGVRFTVTNPGV